MNSLAHSAAKSGSIPGSEGAGVQGHTPGPWKACPSIEDDFLGVYPDTGRHEFPVAKMPDYVRPEVKVANARLIAAAPDLLEALDDLLSAIGTHDPEWAWQERSNARAAIAKARASQPAAEMGGE